MERNNRKVKSSLIFLIIFLLLIVPLSIFSAYNILKYNKANDERKKIENDLSSLEKEIKYLNEDQSTILYELNNLKNIDENIQTKKQNVFDLAKKLEEKILNNESNYKIAYLTFDDGPYYLTYSVLDVLKQNKVKATFFTIGTGKETCYDNRYADCTEVYSKITENGHTIANHTYSHAIFYGLYNSVDSFMNEVIKQEENIKSKTGVTTNILRFPGGSSSAGNLKNGIVNRLRERGCGWVDWTASDGDGGSLDSKQTAWRNFTGSINENIEVVLFHDYSNITLSILPDAINYLKENNYIILPLFFESVKINK